MARHAGTNARTRESGIAARFAAIETGRVTRPRRTLVYGTHGIGKSSFAARFPSAIVVQTEEGLSRAETCLVSLRCGEVVELDLVRTTWVLRRKAPGFAGAGWDNGQWGCCEDRSPPATAPPAQASSSTACTTF